MPASDPDHRKALASIAALERHAKHDTRAATKPARDAFLASFEAQVPDIITDPAERLKSAERLRRAHMQRLALRSVEARRRRTQVPSDAP